MAVHVAHKEKDTLYFITFTCYNWMPLFETTNFYDGIYSWFKIIKLNGGDVIGYVIMPNHLHALVYVGMQSSEINKIVANGKRFMAYDIVQRLKTKQETAILNILENKVPERERKKGKLHQVFEPSFDCKPCYTRNFTEQKLNYIHRNPCAGKWNLANEYTDYLHSSGAFYELDLPIPFMVRDYRLMDWL